MSKLNQDTDLQGNVVGKFCISAMQNSMEKGMAAHSSILAEIIPWDESMGSQRVWTGLSLHAAGRTQEDPTGILQISRGGQTNRAFH